MKKGSTPVFGHQNPNSWRELAAVPGGRELLLITDYYYDCCSSVFTASPCSFLTTFTLLLFNTHARSLSLSLSSSIIISISSLSCFLLPFTTFFSLGASLLLLLLSYPFGHPLLLHFGPKETGGSSLHNHLFILLRIFKASILRSCSWLAWTLFCLSSTIHLQKTSALLLTREHIYQSQIPNI